MATGAALVVVVPVGLFANLFDGLAPKTLTREVSGTQMAAGPPVLLVSIDGLAPRVQADTPTPTLDRLAREGRVARKARTVMPSATLPAHTSMLSGLTPEQHGVGWNRYEPWRRYAVPTVFTICAEQKLRCGLFAGKAKFAHLARDETGVERFALGADAGAVFDAALAYLREREPHFVMLHVAEVDLSGHREGWGSDAQKAALRSVDGLLGAFLAEVGQERRPILVLTSDHGGHDTRHGTDAPEDMHIPWILWGEDVVPGEITEPISTVDTAATLLALLGVSPPTGWAGRSRYP